MGDAHTPLRDQLNRSGVPFQIAVAQHVRNLAEKRNAQVPSELMIREVISEVPVAEGLVDLTARVGDNLFVFECKRVDSGNWLFAVSENGLNETWCRLEYFNGAFQRIPVYADDPVFCDD